MSDFTILEQKAIADFEDQIKKAIDFGASSREDAIRWLIEGSDADMREVEKHGEQYLCFQFNLPLTEKHFFEAFVRDLKGN